LNKTIVSIVILNIFVRTTVLFGEEGYKYENMWPHQTENWYFYNPDGITGDTNGYIYIADTQNIQIQKFSTHGNFVTKWKKWQSMGERNQFSDPRSVAVDQRGDVYVTDSGKNRIVKFDANGNWIDWKIDYTGSQGLDSPYGIYIRNDKIYVTDIKGIHIFHHNKEVMTIPVAYEKTLKHIYVSVSEDIYVINSGEIVIYVNTSNEYNVYKTLTHTNLRFPVGIGVDNDMNIYVSDVYANCIHKWDKNHNYINWNRTIEKPQGLWISEDNLIYVTDKNHNVQKFSIQGKLLSIWGPLHSDQKFVTPEAIDIDSDNYIYVIDSATHQVTVMDQNGTISTKWELDEKDGYPAGIAVNTNKQVYISDKKYGKLFKFSVDGQLLKQADGLKAPHGIEIDTLGNVYVANALTNEIIKFDTDLNRLDSYHCDISYPLGLAIDKDNTIFACDLDNNRIVKFIDSQSCESFINEGLHKPTEITISDDSMFVIQSSKNSVKRYSLNGTYLETITDTGGNFPGQVNNPGNCKVLEDKLLIADCDNHRIQLFSKGISNNNKAIIVVGGGDYSGNDLWDATQICGFFAYRILAFCGFQKEDIILLSSGRTFDYDGNSTNIDIVKANTDNLKMAIAEFGAYADQLVVYMVDHGDHEQFHLNYNTKLSALELAEWLPLNKQVLIIYDACQSKSFYNQLDNDNMIVITSADREAYFVSNGMLSFSYFFWKKILSGNTVKNSFDYARDSIKSITFNLQHPELLSQIDLNDVYIGQKSRLSDSAIHFLDVGYESEQHLLYAKIDSQVEAVWVEIIPPNLKTIERPSNAPVIAFQKILLDNVENNTYQALYSNPFGIQLDVYFFAKSQRQKDDISISESVRIPPETKVNRKALLLSNIDAEDAIKNIDLAYHALTFQGLSDNDITIISPLHYSPTESHVIDTINQWKITNNLEQMIIYFTGLNTGNKSNFFLNEHERLSGENIQLWLNDIIEKNNTQTIFIYDSDYNESFLNRIKNIDNIIVIGASKKTQPCTQIDISACEGIQFVLSRLYPQRTEPQQYANSFRLFSLLLWKEIWSGKVIRKCFENSKIALDNCMKNQITPFYYQRLPVDISMPVKVGVGIHVDVGYVIPSIILNVKDSFTLKPVSTIFVSTSPFSLTNVYSSHDGIYPIYVMETQDIRIKVSANHYTMACLQTSINDGENKTVDIRLSPGDFEYTDNAAHDIPVNYEPNDINEINCFISILTQY